MVEKYDKIIEEEKFEGRGHSTDRNKKVPPYFFTINDVFRSPAVLSSHSTARERPLTLEACIHQIYS